MAKRVVIVGAGIGGLAVAIRLRAAGNDVAVFERNEMVGGKVATFERDGYTFDLGPSLLTLPDVFDSVFRLAGTSLREQLDLVRLDPQFRYAWPDGSTLIVHDDPDATARSFDEFAQGAGAQWREFQRRGEQIWDVSGRTFLEGPMSSPWSLLRRARSPRDFHTIDALRTLHRSASATFDDPRLQQWAGRYATYSGSSPYRAPATLACIPHVESSAGCWHPIGGMGMLRLALARVAQGIGIELATGADVRSVSVDAEAVTGVVLADGTAIRADAVVANVDAEHLYADLLPDRSALRRVRRADRSTSGVVFCAAVRGRTPDIAHHNVWFSSDDRREFEQLRAGTLADDPTIYACVSAVTDSTQAPDGNENWAFLVNVPAGVEVDANRHESLVLDRLGKHGIDLRERIEFTHTMTPADIERRYRSPGGAIYGAASNGRRAAFLRPRNRGVRTGLYLVGGSSHPGGGLPLVATSAEIVAGMLERDGIR